MFKASDGRVYNYGKLNKEQRRYLHSLIIECMVKDFSLKMTMMHINNLFMDEYNIPVSQALYYKERAKLMKNLKKEMENKEYIDLELKMAIKEKIWRMEVYHRDLNRIFVENLQDPKVKIWCIQLMINVTTAQAHLEMMKPIAKKFSLVMEKEIESIDRQMNLTEKKRLDIHDANISGFMELPEQILKTKSQADSRAIF